MVVYSYYNRGFAEYGFLGTRYFESLEAAEKSAREQIAQGQTVLIEQGDLGPVTGELVFALLNNSPKLVNVQEVSQVAGEAEAYGE